MPAGDDSDVLTGDAAIGAFLGWKPRTVRYRAGLGEIPTFKIGRARCATKSGLRAYLLRQMAAAESKNADPDRTSKPPGEG